MSKQRIFSGPGGTYKVLKAKQNICDSCTHCHFFYYVLAKVDDNRLTRNYFLEVQDKFETRQEAVVAAKLKAGLSQQVRNF